MSVSGTIFDIEVVVAEAAWFRFGRGVLMSVASGFDANGGDAGIGRYPCVVEGRHAKSRVVG